MGNLMPDEHIVLLVRHILERGQSEKATLDIERCGLRLRIMYDIDVLTRQQAAEKRLGCLVGGRVHAVIVPNSKTQSTPSERK